MDKPLWISPNDIGPNLVTTVFIVFILNTLMQAVFKDVCISVVKAQFYLADMAQSVTASPYSVEEVFGSRPGHVILTASLFGAEHIRDRVGGYSYQRLTSSAGGTMFLAGLTLINTEVSTVCMGH